jgi:hypothetical protein
MSHFIAKDAHLIQKKSAIINYAKDKIIKKKKSLHYGYNFSIPE